MPFAAARAYHALRQAIARRDAYLKSRRDSWFAKKWHKLLERAETRRSPQLVALDTFPVSLLVEPSPNAAAAQMASRKTDIQHGVKSRARQLCRPGAVSDSAGEIADQMFWGVAKMMW